MGKRIALFVVGFVIAIGAFWLYQYFSGASFLSARKPVAIGGGGGAGEHPPTYEQRAPNGELLYLLSAKKAAPSKDENGKPMAGQYDLTEPTATYYTTDGNMLYIRADRGTVSIDDRASGGIAGGRGSKAGISERFRGAHLAGDVLLTYGPRESFTDNSLDIKAGQFQVRFEKDLDLNYAEGIVTSPGLVHLRADQDRMRFDGENLTIAFNRSEKKQEIELLRIEPTSGKDNYMLIKDVGRQGFSLDEAATARPGGGPAIPAETQGAKADVASTAAASGPATRDAGGEKPAAVIYKVSLGQDVTATLGGRKLTTPSLFVFFQSPNGQANKKAATASAAPDGVAPAATATAPVASAPGSAPVKEVPDDLVVTWKGPLEMRPAAADAGLSDKRDIALEAVGTAEQPVRVEDGTSVARAGILQYHRAAQSVALSPGVAGPVVITYVDATDSAGGGAGGAVMMVTSSGVNFSRLENHVRLEGPGHIEVPQAALRRGAAGANVTGKPLAIAWERALDVDLAPGRGGKNANKVSIRRALFAGRSSITNVDFSLGSNALDILVAASGGGGDAKSVVLEHLLATGNVQVKGESRPGAGIADAALPNGVNADRLEVMTAMAEGNKARSPSRLLADGNVAAWAYQADQGMKAAHLSRQTLYTPKLDVRLASKGRAGAGGTSGIGGNVTATSLVASDGVIVELEGFGAQTVFAKAKTLSADMSSGRDSARVTLEGEQLADGAVENAEVSQGERGANKISALRMLLDQKSRSIHIPVRGAFDFVQQGQKPGDAPIPAEVTWSQSMDYNGKTLLAHFLGEIDAHLVGSTDKISKLTCNRGLDVQLATDDRAGTGASRMHLAKIAARGNVNVQSTTLDPAGKVLTSIYLAKTDALDYTEGTKTLLIPGPGEMLIQDYRTEKGEATSDNSHGDTVFTWDKDLAYAGPAGTITFTKNVWMKHRPLKPFKVPGAAVAPPAGGPGVVAPAENQPLVLITDLLVAKLDQSKATGGGDTAASPFAMSAGGTQKLESVLATGHSVLTLGESKLKADDLGFNNLTHIATATGSDELPAEMFQPGEALLQGTRISWDVTKGKNAIQVTGIRGALQQN